MGANVEVPLEVLLMGVTACLTLGDAKCDGRLGGLMDPAGGLG